MIVDYEKEFEYKFDNLISTLECVPSNRLFICHYTSASALQKIIESNSLHLTRWDFLNDESELLHIHDIVEVVLDKKTYLKEFKLFILEVNERSKKSKNNKDFHRRLNNYILSFSDDKDSLPMWTYYTKNNQSDGYNIEFRAEEFLKGLSFSSDEDIQLIKLIYNSNAQKEIVGNLLDATYSLYDNSKFNKNMIAEHFEYSVSILSKFLKHSAFKHEKEYRIVLKTTSENECVREKNGVFVPYIPLMFDKNSVEKINISPTLSKRNPHIGLRTLLKNNEYNCEWECSEIPFRNI